MEIKTKKMIAREFLILVAVFTIGLTSFLATYPYNWIKSFQINKLNNTINYKAHIADSLAKSYDRKTFNNMDYISRIYVAFKEGATVYDLPISNSPTSNLTEPEFRQKILSDTVYRNVIYQIFKDRLEGFTKTKREFFYSIQNQLNQIDLKQKAQSNEIKNNLTNLNIKKSKIESSKLNLIGQMSFALKILIVVAFMSFPIRFLYYGIIWSLTTVKLKHD